MKYFQRFQSCSIHSNFWTIFFFFLSSAKHTSKKLLFMGSFCQGLCPFCVHVSKRSQKWTLTDCIESLSTHPSLLPWLKDIVYFVLVVLRPVIKTNLPYEWDKVSMGFKPCPWPPSCSLKFNQYLEFQNQQAKAIRSVTFWPVYGRTHPASESMG